MYYANRLSKYILIKCIKDNQPINNLYLQCILYNIQKKSLQTFGKRMLWDEFEAFGFGAVVPNVYYEYCMYGVENIRHEELIGKPDNLNLTMEAKAIVDDVTTKIRGLKFWDLPKSPAWEKVWDNGRGRGMIVPVELIRVLG